MVTARQLFAFQGRSWITAGPEAMAGGLALAELCDNTRFIKNFLVNYAKASRKKTRRRGRR